MQKKATLTFLTGLNKILTMNKAWREWQGGCAWRGTCMVGACVGGMCGRGAGMARGVWQGGACVVGHAWQGACMAGGMHGRGHAWQGACVGCVCGRGMHGRGHMWQGGMCGGGHACQGACVAGRHAWQWGMHGRGCAWQGASYWNAFLFSSKSTEKSNYLNQFSNNPSFVRLLF